MAFVITACVQIEPARVPAESVTGTGNGAVETPLLFRQFYTFDIDARSAGFSLFLNGTELVFFEGDGDYSASTPLNDWMLPGENNFSITIIPFPPAAAASFRFSLKQQTDGAFPPSVLFTFAWPEDGARREISGRFGAEGFPDLLAGKAERVISSSGVLPRSDQGEITVLTQAFRQALSEKNIDALHSLLEAKYRDAAAVRFIPAEEYRAESGVLYSSLMEKPGFTVLPLYGGYTFHSTADDRLVKVMQGRAGFPEPAVIVEYREGGVKVRREHDLYFAKINGRWAIIR